MMFLGTYLGILWWLYSQTKNCLNYSAFSYDLMKLHENAVLWHKLLLLEVNRLSIHKLML